MKSPRLLVSLLLLIILILCITVGPVSAAGLITVTPSSGFAATTISGSGFTVFGTVQIYWDSNATPLPTIPQVISTSANSTSFTAIITVPTQADVGTHTVTVRVTPATGGTAETAQTTLVVL